MGDNYGIFQTLKMYCDRFVKQFVHYSHVINDTNWILPSIRKNFKEVNFKIYFWVVEGYLFVSHRVNHVWIWISFGMFMTIIYWCIVLCFEDTHFWKFIETTMFVGKTCFKLHFLWYDLTFKEKYVWHLAYLPRCLIYLNG